MRFIIIPEMKFILCILSFFLTIGSCRKDKIVDITPLISNDLIRFSFNEIPASLQNLIDKNRIIFLGETHYVQEHQEFVSLLLEKYSYDSLIFITESFSAFNWIVDDYVNNKINYLPNCIRFFDNLWFEKIKEINAEGKTRVQAYCMDVNHWKDNFINSVKESEKIRGEQPIFEKIKYLDANSKEYYEALSKLKDQLVTNKESYIQKWGNLWYDRYYQMVDFEISSNAYRRNNEDEKFRELFLYDFVLSIAEKYPHHKIMVDCGMYHAQKQTLMGENIQRLAGYLTQKYPENTASIAFVGMKGERKFHFYDQKAITFDIERETAQNDIIHCIGKVDNDSLTLLNLGDSKYLNKYNITYISGNTINLSPGKQFDALVTFPEIHILRSMNEFDY